MYLLDTDTLIYALKGVPEVRKNLEAHRSDRLAVSVVTLMELYYGAHKSQRREANLAKVRAIEEAFEVVPLGSECVATFGLLKAQLERQGTPLDDFDLMLAAVSLAHNLTLVSNNLRHFRRIEGLALENWAADPEP
jgi:tRNA(fMet)-specific endonuclease VapC